MDDEFYKYLTSIGRKQNTAYSYKNSINRISEHYSENTQQNINIYEITDLTKISEIANSYSLDGVFSEAGKTGNGTWRNAIARYAEYYVNKNAENIYIEHKDTSISNEVVESSEQQINFAYERDLQRTLCSQVAELFHGYKIFGENNQGIEYRIGKRRIDVLLEHIETGDLLIVELKSGEADYKVFGQISMYLGLLQNKFSNRNISGVIISGSIHEGLQQACTTTDKIKLKVYRMNLELEES